MLVHLQNHLLNFSCQEVVEIHIDDSRYTYRLICDCYCLTEREKSATKEAISILDEVITCHSCSLVFNSYSDLWSA